MTPLSELAWQDYHGWRATSGTSLQGHGYPFTEGCKRGHATGEQRGFVLGLWLGLALSNAAKQSAECAAPDHADARENRLTNVPNNTANGYNKSAPVVEHEGADSPRRI